MGITEQVFLLALVSLGVVFQVRLWRELPIGKPLRGFQVFGLSFCAFVQALSAYSWCSS